MLKNQRLEGNLNTVDPDETIWIYSVCKFGALRVNFLLTRILKYTMM